MVVLPGSKMDVWREAKPFYAARGWERPDVVLLRRRLNKKKNH